MTPSTHQPDYHISPLGLQSVAAYPLPLGRDMGSSATCQLAHHINTHALQHDAIRCVISWQSNVNPCVVPIKWYVKHDLGTGTKHASKVWPLRALAPLKHHWVGQHKVSVKLPLVREHMLGQES